MASPRGSGVQLGEGGRAFGRVFWGGFPPTSSTRTPSPRHWALAGRKNTVYRWEKELMGIREPSARLIRLLAKMAGEGKRKRRGT